MPLASRCRSSCPMLSVAFRRTPGLVARVRLSCGGLGSWSKLRTLQCGETTCRPFGFGSARMIRRESLRDASWWSKSMVVGPFAMRMEFLTPCGIRWKLFRKARRSRPGLRCRGRHCRRRRRMPQTEDGMAPQGTAAPGPCVAAGCISRRRRRNRPQPLHRHRRRRSVPFKRWMTPVNSRLVGMTRVPEYVAVIVGGPNVVVAESVSGPILEGHAASRHVRDQVLSAQSGTGPDGFLSTPLSSCASRHSVRSWVSRDRAGDWSPASVGQSRSNPLEDSGAAGGMHEVGHVGPDGSPSVRIGSWDLCLQGPVTAYGVGSGPSVVGHDLDRGSSYLTHFASNCHAFAQAHHSWCIDWAGLLQCAAKTKWK